MAERLKFIYVLILICGLVRPAYAADMTQVQNLDFGEFAVLNNSSVHTIVVSPTNVVNYSPAMIRGNTSAQRAEYSLTGLPASIPLGITIDNPDPLSESGFGIGQMFSVGTYTHNNPSSNGGGNATLYIGATLSTSGSGVMYNNGSYVGSMDITINF